MKRINKITTLLVGLLLLNPASAQDEPDKIGTVSMQKLVAEYYKMVDLKKAFQADAETVTEKDKERVENIKKLVEESRKLQTEAENANLPREKQEELMTKMVSQRREAQALESARVSWLQRKQAAFKEKEVIEKGKLRKEIVEMVKEVGKERGFDYIFDRSGASGANVSILAYAKDATDLTATMIERINRDAPEGGDEKKEEKKSTDGENGAGE